MRKENKEAIEIDLKRLLMILWYRLWIILLVAILASVAAVGYAKLFVAPTYSANAQFYVNNTYNSPGFSSSQIVAAQNLADTYMVILKSRSVLDEVRKDVNLGYTYDQLRQMVSTNSVNGTEVFQVTVTCGNYKHATQIANSIADILPDRIAQVVAESSVRVVDRAVEKPVPEGPVYREYGVIGCLVGVLLSTLIVLAVDLTDTTVNTEDYLATVYSDVPLLAVIPGTESTKNGYYKGYYETKKQPVKKTGGGK